MPSLPHPPRLSSDCNLNESVSSRHRLMLYSFKETLKTKDCQQIPTEDSKIGRSLEVGDFPQITEWSPLKCERFAGGPIAPPTPTAHLRRRRAERWRARAGTTAGSEARCPPGWERGLRSGGGQGPGPGRAALRDTSPAPPPFTGNDRARPCARTPSPPPLHGRETETRGGSTGAETPRPRSPAGERPAGARTPRSSGSGARAITPRAAAGPEASLATYDPARGGGRS